MPVERIQWDKQDVVLCDDRGRATLGSEFANEQVFVYVAETPSLEETEPMPDKEEETLVKMNRWAHENIDADYFRMDAEDGTVMDKQGNEYQTPYRYDIARDEIHEVDE